MICTDLQKKWCLKSEEKVDGSLDVIGGLGDWTYEQLRAGWQEIEALGFDACYMGDDLFPHHFDDDPANAEAQVEVYDPWTVMAVMAETTERMRIGSLVSPAGRRHPVLFAKMTSIVDVISNGRLSVGLGSGNAPDQAHALGEPYLKA